MTERKGNYKRPLAILGNAIFAGALALENNPQLPIPEQNPQNQLEIPGFIPSEEEFGKVVESAPSRLEINPGKKDFLKEVIVKNIWTQVKKAQEERAKTDSRFDERVDKELNENRINIVLLGIGKEGSLTDLIMILSYDTESGILSLIPLPRDVQSPEVLQKTRNPANSRVNQALAYGGLALVRETLENATGLAAGPIFKIRFDAASDLIDETIGYVEVDVQATISDPFYPADRGYGYSPFYLPAGRQRLDGQNAVKYARTRLYPGGNDYQRGEHQQEIVAAFLKRIEEEGSNPLNWPHLITSLKNVLEKKAASRALETDFNINDTLSSLLGAIILTSPNLAAQQLSDGWEINFPQTQNIVFDPKNLLESARIPGVAITKIRGGNPYDPNPKDAYWKRFRQFIRESLE